MAVCQGGGGKVELFNHPSLFSPGGEDSRPPLYLLLAKNKEKGDYWVHPLSFTNFTFLHFYKYKNYGSLFRPRRKN